MGLAASLQYWRDAFFSDVIFSHIKNKNVSNDIDYVAFPTRIVNIDLGYRFIQHVIERYFSNTIELAGQENLSEYSPDFLTSYQTDLYFS
ncbi:MAG: hypothetical protein HRU20_07430 [Pseudomonadales bacterium]|nr:hypothetical protein [Pseudomonadales bacterium]